MSGSVTTVSAGQVATGIANPLFGSILVLSGGTTVNATVYKGAETVNAGGIAIATELGGLGFLSVSGITRLTLISGGNTETVFAGGVSTGTTVLNGTEIVASGGIANGLLLSGGRNEIQAGGVANAATVAGGSQIVSVGGAAYDTVLTSGSIVVASGGITQRAVVSGGFQQVFDGGSAASTSVRAGGTLQALSGATVTGALLGGAGQVFMGGLATGATVTAGGSHQIYSGGTDRGASIAAGGTETVYAGGLAASPTVAGGGTLSVQAQGSATAVTLADGARLDLGAVPFAPGGSATLSGTTLTIAQGGAAYSQSVAGDYTGEYFHLAADGTGGTLVTVDGTPCYCRGTLILTDRGERPIEDLVIGDHLVTNAGPKRPIRWIGRRAYDGRVAAGNPDITPVRIPAGALSAGVPRRDLLVSPLHALFLDGALVPAIALAGVAGIAQVTSIENVEYIHLELDTHDVILAEGAPAESFADDGSRGMFQNAVDYRARYPDAPPEPPRWCAPRIERGSALEAIRNRLAPHAPPSPLTGHLDEVTRDTIRGWARTEPGPARLRILANDRVLGEIVADGPRPDLAAAGFGDGRHGFHFTVPGGLAPGQTHVIEVRSLDGQALADSPCRLDIPAISAVPAAPPCQGHVDTLTRDRIAGWACDPDHPGVPVPLQVTANGIVIARTLANAHRPDLVRAGIGTGRHGFDLVIPGGLSPLTRHIVEITDERSGTALPGTPRVIEPATAFDHAIEQAVAARVEAAGDADQARVLSFLLAQVDRLRRRSPPATQGKRALVLDARAPGRDAGSAAVLSHVAALRRLGYAVSFAAALDMGADFAIPGADRLGIPAHATVEDALRAHGGGFEVVYLHRAEIAARYLALARAACPRARILYSVADLHALRLERQAVIERRPELLAESRRMRLLECTAAWSADAVLTHSAREAEWLRHAVPGASIHRVPWAVPARADPPGFQPRQDIAFIGHYAHAPNADAARVLAESVMPLVHATHPGIRCMLVGPALPAALRRLPGRRAGRRDRRPRSPARPGPPDRRPSSFRRRDQGQGTRQPCRRRSLRHDAPRRRGHPPGPRDPALRRRGRPRSGRRHPAPARGPPVPRRRSGRRHGADPDPPRRTRGRRSTAGRHRGTPPRAGHRIAAPPAPPLPSRPGHGKRRAWSARASPPARPACCISAAPGRPCSTSCSAATTAANTSSASRTPTRSAAPRPSRPPSSTASPGSASPPTSPPSSSPPASPATPRSRTTCWPAATPTTATAAPRS